MEEALVQPIPKMGNKTLLANYRPGTLMSIILKVMEIVINIQLINFQKKINIVSDR